MRWPWSPRSGGYAVPAAGVDGAPEPAPVPVVDRPAGSGLATVALQRREWASLPPMTRTIGPAGWVRPDLFARSLPSRTPPTPMRQRLAHEVRPLAPAGSAVGLARVSGAPVRDDLPPLPLPRAASRGTALQEGAGHGTPARRPTLDGAAIHRAPTPRGAPASMAVRGAGPEVTAPPAPQQTEGAPTEDAAGPRAAGASAGGPHAAALSGAAPVQPAGLRATSGAPADEVATGGEAGRQTVPGNPEGPPDGPPAGPGEADALGLPATVAGGGLPLQPRRDDHHEVLGLEGHPDQGCQGRGEGRVHRHEPARDQAATAPRGIRRLGPGARRRRRRRPAFRLDQPDGEEPRQEQGPPRDAEPALGQAIFRLLPQVRVGQVHSLRQ